MDSLPQDIVDFLLGLRTRPMTAEERILADAARIVRAYAEPEPLPDFPGRLCQRP